LDPVETTDSVVASGRYAIDFEREVDLQVRTNCRNHNVRNDFVRSDCMLGSRVGKRKLTVTYVARLERRDYGSRTRRSFRSCRPLRALRTGRPIGAVIAFTAGEA
jgi:hypothetical protein